jgi:predicted nucleic acid-binding protein
VTGRTCDTSVLVPALVSWHPGHAESREAVAQATAVPAHVLMEAYSVLTRLPSPHRVAAAAAAEVLAALALEPVVLPGAAQRTLIAVLGPAGIRGGAVYDALVGATAQHHSLHLVTRDRRARAAYDELGVGYTLVQRS